MEPVASKADTGPRLALEQLFADYLLHSLLGEAFPIENVTVHVYGNVLTALAGLHGIISSELTPEELNHHDPAYQVTLAARAMK